MANTLVANNGNAPNSTGQGTQYHVWDDGTNLWHVYLSGTNTLSSQYSTDDGATWTAGASETLSNSHNLEGRNLSLVFKTISVNRILVTVSYNISTTNRKSYVLVGKTSGTTLTWDNASDTQFAANTASDPTTGLYDGQAIIFDSNNKPAASTSHTSSAGADMAGSNFTNAVTSGAWTVGTTTDTDISGVANEVGSHWLTDLGSGNLLLITDNAASTFPAANNLLWSKRTGTTWGASASVFASSTSIKLNGWGAVAVSASDVHVVYQSSTSTFTHRRWNGTSWSNGNSLPTLTFRSTTGAAGMPLFTDGTNVWAFCIDSSSNIKYCKWTSGTGWDASWTTLDSAGGATRNNLQVCPQYRNSRIFVSWTEGSTSPYAIKGATLSLSNSHALTTSPSVNGKAHATSALTVKHPLSATAIGKAKDTAALTVKHPLTATAAGRAKDTAALTVKHLLSATAIGKAKVTASLTDVHHLGATATAKAKATSALTVKHALSATAQGKAHANGTLTFRHALAATAVAKAHASGSLDNRHSLSTTTIAKAHAQAAITVKHRLTATAAARAYASGSVGKGHLLSATATAKAHATAAPTVRHLLSAVAQAKGKASTVLGVRHLLSATAEARAYATGRIVNHAAAHLEKVKFSLFILLNASFAEHALLQTTFTVTDLLQTTFAEIQPVPFPNTHIESVVTATNKAGTPVPGCTPVTCVVTFPDKSTQSFALGSGIVDNADGTYTLTYKTKGVGTHVETWSLHDPTSGHDTNPQRKVPVSY